MEKYFFLSIKYKFDSFFFQYFKVIITYSLALWCFNYDVSGISCDCLLSLVAFKVIFLNIWFNKFDFYVPMCHFHCIYPIWDLLSFLKILLILFINLENYQPFFSNDYFFLILSSLPGTSYISHFLLCEVLFTFFLFEVQFG